VQVLDGELVLSASDLTGFAACAHLTQLELQAARGERERPDRDDPLLDVLSRLGTAHETAQLDVLRADTTKTVVEIDYPDHTRAALHEAQQETVDAMRKGVDVIYQATFFDGRWRGHADFLLRVDGPCNGSDLGAWSYEVADAKLARRVKAAAILQMCAYSDQLAALQGRVPRYIHVVTGDGEWNTEKLSDYSAYYRALKARYEALVLGGPDVAPDAPDAATYPDPVDHCGVCRWSEVCAAKRRADDHLSLVAGMRRDQTRKLVAAGVVTTTGLAAIAPDALSADSTGIGEPTLERLRHQAELQVESRDREPARYEVLEPEETQRRRGRTPGTPERSRPEEERPTAGELALDPDTPWLKRGFAALPEPSPGDLFFDMEGDPYALDGDKLEYLFGVVELDDVTGEPRYHAFWAHDRDGEKQAFEAFVDLAVRKLAADPDMHIYHYAFYEPAAVKRLMGIHGTRETEVDVLLRGERFVDLYAVVHQGVRIGAESYSLKSVEKQYMTRPQSDVMDAGSSIVFYERWLEEHDQQILDQIEAYNRDDCESTRGLRAWLEERRTEAEQRYGPIPRPTLRDGEASEALTEREQQAEAIAVRLRAGEHEHPAYGILAELLSWYRREEKPQWWAYFHRVGFESDDDFVDDRECVGGLELVDERKLDDDRRSICRYRFEPQDHKFTVTSEPEDPATQKKVGEIVDIDDARGIIVLERTGRRQVDAPHPRALIPGTPYGTALQQAAIVRVAEWVADHGLDAPGPYQAARDLLLRRPPASLTPGNGTYLAVQGPPGSGKTFTGAHMICDLVDDGQRIGITAHSHAAIGKLLDEVMRVAAERGQDVSAIQKSKEHQRCAASGVVHVDDNGELDAHLEAHPYDVVAGTSWLWSRPEMEGAVDVLFVDEAGQKSLADIVAVSAAAASIVLLGDPQQLAQPFTGSHPDGVAVSALEYLLDGEETMPPELGLFLETTHRMHPDVCAFVSEVAYDGRLRSEPGLEQQSVDGRAGLLWVPVEHQGNRTASDEEAVRVRELLDDLLGTKWTDKHGATREVTLDDVLVVAPYNAHVARLQQHLPDGARVGTVDKFQGQEAPVTIYSMATSTADDAPRGMEFLYDLHRLNVAVSRAKGLSILVCSPALLRVLCRTPDDLRLANALCRYVEGT
jgi:uncharacterized protein